MIFKEFKRYLNEISALEFSERDNEINHSASQLKGEMNSRGILISSITLQRLAEFFYSEYEARSKFIRSFIVENIGKLDLKTLSDPITEAKTLFQAISEAEKIKLSGMYDAVSAQARSGLHNQSFQEQIDNALFQKMDILLKKNNLYVEFEYKACTEAKSSDKDILFLTPNIQGIGVDLKELWVRIFKT